MLEIRLGPKVTASQCPSPKGSEEAWGGPALSSLSPKVIASQCPSPKGSKKAWGGPALSFSSFGPKVTASQCPSPKGSEEAWGSSALLAVSPKVMASSCPAARRSRGFTLVEAVIVIVITGILMSIVARFVVAPVQAYLATVARASMVDTADTALRRIGRDLRIALPNSTRVSGSGLALELIPTTGGARYVTEGSGRLDFGTIDTSFDLIGPALTLTASQQLVFYNLGTGITGSDAYAANSSAVEQANSNRRSATNGAGTATTLTLSSAAGLPVGDFAPPYRVQAVGTPITYRCDLSAGTLTRYQGYGFVATQPDPPSGGTSALLANGVTDCRFSYDAVAIAARAALVNLQLTLTATTSAGSESISLHHAIHVDNLP